MNKFYGSLIIGLTSALCTVAPMIFTSRPISITLSYAFYWIILGFIIPYLDWPIGPGLKGFIAAEILAVPLLILLYQTDFLALVSITVFAAILGPFISTMGKKLKIE